MPPPVIIWVIMLPTHLDLPVFYYLPGKRPSCSFQTWATQWQNVILMDFGLWPLLLPTAINQGSDRKAVRHSDGKNLETSMKGLIFPREWMGTKETNKGWVEALWVQQQQGVISNPKGTERSLELGEGGEVSNTGLQERSARLFTSSPVAEQ